MRQRTRQGARRVRATALPVAQASLAALLAWVITHDLLGHPAPFLAPIAAWICLGFTFNRVPRKVLELGVGAAIGVAVGELIFAVAGTGAVQIGAGLLVGALVGRFLDRGDLFTMQAGVNAMVVIGMGNLLGAAGGVTRLADAVVGALVAFVVSVALPGDLTVRPRRNLRGVLEELGRTLGMMADGVRRGDAEVLTDAHAQAGGVLTILTDAGNALNSSSEIVRYNPALWKYRPQVGEQQRILALGTRLDHTIELLLRQCRGMVDEMGASAAAAELMEDAGAVMGALAGAVGNWHPPDRARALAIDLAQRCGPSHYRDAGWRMHALLSIMRSVAIDLLQLSGLSRAQARQHLPDTGMDEADEAGRAALPEDEASEVWGEVR